MKILVISNGRGEDVLAITFLKALQTLRNSRNLEIDCLPLVGDGLSYQKAEFSVIKHWHNLPSQGFLMGWQNWLSDLAQGLVGQTLSQIDWLKKNVSHYDVLISFGDFTSVFFLSLSLHPAHYHCNTALTVYLRNFWQFEMWLMQRDCKKVFVRDAASMEFLQAHGVAAFFEGSLMLDDANLLQTDPILNLPNELIVLLPSSRADALYNSEYLIALLCKHSWPEHFVLALHPDLPVAPIQKIMRDKSFQVPIYQGSLGNLIHKARAMLGMSGTGCEQMAAMGVPVILVETKMPASNHKRMQHYEKVLGQACQILSGKIDQQAQQLKTILEDSDLLNKMRRAGPERFGKPGASLRIAQTISRECL